MTVSKACVDKRGFFIGVTHALSRYLPLELSCIGIRRKEERRTFQTLPLVASDWIRVRIPAEIAAISTIEKRSWTHRVLGERRERGNNGGNKALFA